MFHSYPVNTRVLNGLLYSLYLSVCQSLATVTSPSLLSQNCHTFFDLTLTLQLEQTSLQLLVTIPFLSHQFYSLISMSSTYYQNVLHSGLATLNGVPANPNVVNNSLSSLIPEESPGESPSHL